MKKMGLGVGEFGVRGFGVRGLGHQLPSPACGRGAGGEGIIPHPSSLIPYHSAPVPRPLSLAPRAFTLVEMLVTVSIIAILAAMAFGALAATRESAREAATRATIAKLHNIVMRRYESYLTRRVPIQTTGLPPKTAAQIRLIALRQIMRMEMPERWSDIINPAMSGNSAVPDEDGVVVITGDLPGGGTVSRTINRPALSRLYAQRYKSLMPDTKGSPGYGPAECLYLLVSMGSPEAMEQFTPAEIGDVDGDGYPEFIDGWGRPIMWLRCAPGYVSPLQNQTDHDPFDARNVEPAAYHLIPLIYSAGPDGKYDIEIDYNFQFQGDPYANPAIGQPVDENGDGMNHHDNITNHQIQSVR
jgi:prepilin-type N-terminal cleavage/methylation domain-containing protein